MHVENTVAAVNLSFLSKQKAAVVSVEIVISFFIVFESKIELVKKKKGVSSSYSQSFINW